MRRRVDRQPWRFLAPWPLALVLLGACGNVTINVGLDDARAPTRSGDAAALDADEADAAPGDVAAEDVAQGDIDAKDLDDTVDTWSPDTTIGDASEAETAEADTTTADTAASDTEAPDTTVADTAAPDTTASDSIGGDTATNDTATNDTATNDTATTDTAEPDTTPPSDTDAGPGCVVTGPETCNGVDDDCDGATDEATCDDGLACTTDVCGGTTGCSHQSSGAPCDDGDLCTTGDSCTLDGCKPDGATNCDDANPCTQDTCDADTGCSHAPASGPCDDGKPCTTNDSCTGGSCVGVVAACDDGNLCTTDNCGGPTGCSHTANTLPCDDGDPCTSDEACTKGSCGGGTVASCDDGNACTLDTCKAGKGCSNVAAPNGTACEGGSCVAGTCEVKVLCKAGTLKGTLSIGPKGSYTTFGQALAALNANGVCGPTTFVVAGGTYTEAAGFVFKPIAGAGAAAPVRFEAAAGQTVRLVGASPGTYSAIVRIDAKTSWLTLAGFDLDGKEAANKIGGNYGGPIVFANGGGQAHVRIEGFRVHDFLQTAWASTSYIGGVYMQISGATNTVEFVGNRFENLDPGNSAATQGAICTRNGQHTNMRIVGNTFVGIGHMAAIRLRNGGSWKGLVVANNAFIVSDGHVALSWYGTNMLGDNPLFAHNSVLLGKGGTVMDGKTSTGLVDVRNNVVSAPGSGSFVTNTPLGSYGRNCLNGVTGEVSATVVGPDLLATPQFVSAAAPYDLHLQKGSPCLDQGDLLPAVPLDIDGQTRKQPSDIGADELP